MKFYTELMREDLGLSRTAFAKKYNIPLRTLEAWASGDREAPEYVIDLLGRAVYSDLMNKKAKFYVVAVEFTTIPFIIITDSYYIELSLLIHQI